MTRRRAAPRPLAAALLAKVPLPFLLAGSLPWAAAAHGAARSPPGFLVGVLLAFSL